MPRLLSQILLATLMFPLGFMVYLSVYVALNEYFEWDYQHRSNVIVGFVTWTFVGVYWYRIWRPSVPWNGRRARGKFVAVSIVCPKCGYSLTGLAEARCPECGSQYTLGELLASQPGREPDQLR